MPARYGCGARGADPLTAPIIFETSADQMAVWADVDRETEEEERLVFVERVGFFDAIVWIGDRSGPKTRIDLPTDASVAWHRGWLAVKRRTAWTIDGETHPPDTVLGISFPAFLAGDRRFTKLFEPAERRGLQGFFWCGGRLILSILDDLKPVFEALTPSETGWSRERITGLPDIGVANVWSLDVRTEELNGDLLASAQDPLTPPSLFLVRPAAAPELLKRAPQAFDPAGLVVTRHEATSAGRHARYPMCRSVRLARPVMRRSISRAMAASAYRSCPITIPPSESSGSNAAAPASSPISGAAANSAPPGTRPDAAKASGPRTTISRRSPPTSYGAE